MIAFDNNCYLPYNTSRINDEYSFRFEIMLLVMGYATPLNLIHIVILSGKENTRER